jgi:hypothetical protein
MEERDPESSLQVSYLRTDSRLGKMKLFRSLAEVECVGDNSKHMKFEVLDHGCTPVWKLIVEMAKLYCDLALALPIAASVC